MEAGDASYSRAFAHALCDAFCTTASLEFRCDPQQSKTDIVANLYNKLGRLHHALSSGAFDNMEPARHSELMSLLAQGKLETMFLEGRLSEYESSQEAGKTVDKTGTSLLVPAVDYDPAYDYGADQEILAPSSNSDQEDAPLDASVVPLTDRDKQVLTGTKKRPREIVRVDLQPSQKKKPRRTHTTLQRLGDLPKGWTCGGMATSGGRCGRKRNKALYESSKDKTGLAPATRCVVYEEGDQSYYIRICNYCAQRKKLQIYDSVQDLVKNSGFIN